MIDGLQAYRDRMKQIPEAIKLQIEEGTSKIKNKQNKIQYVYYNSIDDLFKRLELLHAERDIGNDSLEVRNEIFSILDLLLKQNSITSKEHIKLYSKVSCALLI